VSKARSRAEETKKCRREAAARERAAETYEVTYDVTCDITTYDIIVGIMISLVICDNTVISCFIIR
jgi:hypothetical protein